MSDPVVVVGGGLAGLAAAARMAKLGHPVELYEESDRLGGAWAARKVDGVLVDDAPSVIGFPAPWRDLFRKSGRPLEAELARMGYELGPAGPPTYVFADGSRLTLPSDRGGQLQTLSAAYGSSIARRWRDLLDELDGVWQALRPLGLESELTGRTQLTRAVRRRLLGRRTLADLAEVAGHPQLVALVRSIGYRLGGAPETTPALAAVELSVSRTFGRWQLQPLAGSTGDPGRSSVLTEALVARLALRRVTVHLENPVLGVIVERSRATGIRTAAGFQPASAVVVTVNPWRTAADLLPATVARRTGRALRRLRPAHGPRIVHRTSPEPPGKVEETVSLDATGVPVLSYRRPIGTGTLECLHDFSRGIAAARYGAEWQGLGSWLRRPRVTGEVVGLFAAGPWSAAGPGPSQVVLSGALAAYAGHAYLDGAG